MKIYRILFHCIALVAVLAGCATTPGNGIRASGDADLVQLVDQARMEYRDGRYSAARQKLERVLEEMPHDAAMNTRAGNAAYREGQYTLAARYYEAALEHSDSPLPRVRYNLAMVRLTQAAIELGHLRRSDEGPRLDNELSDLFMALDAHVGRRVPASMSEAVDEDGNE